MKKWKRKEVKKKKIKNDNNKFDPKLIEDYKKYIKVLENKLKILNEKDEHDFNKYMENESLGITEGQSELQNQLTQNDLDRTKLQNKIKEIKSKYNIK